MLKHFYLLFLVFSFTQLTAQSADFWRAVPNHAVLQQRNAEAVYTPESFASFTLDHAGLASHLLSAPIEFEEQNRAFIVSLPMPEGNTRSFRVYYSTVMEKGLAEKYPQIRSYKGFAVDDRKTNVRFNIGPRGFRAAIYGENNIYIDPAFENDVSKYIVYYTRDYREDVSGYNLSCGMDPYDILEEDLQEEATPEAPEYPDVVLNLRNKRNSGEVCDSVPLYTYRLALSCTGEWASAHGGTVESALEDMVTSVNRINQIYENEFSIRLILIDDNDQLIWLDRDTDPFPVANVGISLLQINTSVINNVVGPNAYDVGHVFTRSCTDVGGVARLSSVCSSFKGNAVTCHYSNNLNYIITNVMAHEMGHQFSAQHTFNNCSGNESAGSDYEPGGGTTIMAYCGLCGGNNVNYDCLENFHAHSVEQIMNFSRQGGGSTCARILSTGNTAPVAALNYKDGFSIPIETPFILEGSAFDCEGDALSYSWEEWDLGPQVQIGQPIEDAPIFTAMEPKDVPFRIFPEMSKIVNNIANNSEILPTYTRPLNFRFIVRDNNPNGGGTDWVNVSFRAEGTAGPFRVTQPAGTSTYTIGQEIEIQWDVANTDLSPVNCQSVNIWLSSDAGYTYSRLLKHKTPNDGSETVILPNVESSLVRFKVEAADNIFFDISDSYSKIVAPETPAYTIEAYPLWQQACLPDVVTVNLETAAFNGFQDTLRFEVVDGLPEGAVARFIPEWVIPGEPVTLELDLTVVNTRAVYELTLRSIPASGDTLYRTVEMDVVTNDYSDLQIVDPVPGTTGARQLPELIWTRSQSADLYNIFLSTSPAFPEDETLSLLGTSDTIYRPESTLKKSTLYYWKIEGINECGNRPATEVMTFSTEAFSCRTYASEELPVDIRSKQTAVLNIEIPEMTQVADVNIIKIEGDHDNFYDLDGSLTGPDGTNVPLFSAKCFQNGALEFSFGLDDESTEKFRCPPYSGTYSPTGTLGDFIGKEANGTWSLEIYDRQSPKGGELAAFELEICANSVLSNPFIVNNNPYQVAIGLPWDLRTEQLRVEDDDNSPGELIYTLVELPLFTTLLRDGSPLKVGDQFSEADIRDGRMQLYAELANHGEQDGFVFTVIDGNGGWLDKTTYGFILDEDVSTTPVSLDSQLNVYPNPASDQVFLQILEPGEYRAELYELTGKRLWSANVNGFERKTLSIVDYEPGVYYLKFQSAGKMAVRKIVKQ
jgi:subtilisin-like proprotein convertase family protein